LLPPPGIAKIPHALHLLAEIGLHGQGLEDGSFELLVLKVWREGHVLEGQHQQVASLISHGQRTTAVGEPENHIQMIKSHKRILSPNPLEGGVKDICIDYGGGHGLHGAVAQIPDVHCAATQGNQDGGVSAAPAGAVNRRKVMLEGDNGQQDASQPNANAPGRNTLNKTPLKS